MITIQMEAGENTSVVGDALPYALGRIYLVNIYITFFFHLKNIFHSNTYSDVTSRILEFVVFILSSCYSDVE